MEALAASGEVGGARGAIFKQMAEMKKKIQLVEGERKAIFEDSEREKEENKERIKKLSEEIKQYKHEVYELKLQRELYCILCSFKKPRRLVKQSSRRWRRSLIWTPRS